MNGIHFMSVDCRIFSELYIKHSKERRASRANEMALTCCGVQGESPFNNSPLSQVQLLMLSFARQECHPGVRSNSSSAISLLHSANRKKSNPLRCHHFSIRALPEMKKMTVTGGVGQKTGASKKQKNVSLIFAQ